MIAGIAIDHAALEPAHQNKAEEDGQQTAEEACELPALQAAGRRRPPVGAEQGDSPRVLGQFAHDRDPQLGAEQAVVAIQQRAGEQLAATRQDRVRRLIEAHRKQAGALHGGVGIVELTLQVVARGGDGSGLGRGLVAGLGTKLFEAHAQGILAGRQVVERGLERDSERFEAAAQILQGRVGEILARQRLLDLFQRRPNAVQLLNGRGGGLRLRWGGRRGHAGEHQAAGQGAQDGTQGADQRRSSGICAVILTESGQFAAKAQGPVSS